MSKFYVDGADLTSVANAIRTKGGTSEALTFPAGFVQAIDDIPTGGGDVDITDASYLFYSGARISQYRDIMKICKKVMSTKSMFEGIPDTSITSIDVTGLDCSEVTDAQRMFAYNSYVKNITGLDTLSFPKVTRFDYMFYGLKYGNPIALPASWFTGHPTSIMNMFDSGTFTSIDVSALDCTELTSMNYACQNNTSLKTVVLPTADMPELINAEGVFRYCSGLTSVNAEGLKNCPKARNFQYTFANCRALTQIDLSNLVSTAASKLFYQCFRNCAALKRVAFGQCCGSVTSSEQMFEGCTALEEVVILDTDNVFTITNASAFNNSGISAGTCKIYVPDTLVNTYKAATNWSTYASQIYGLSDYPDTPWWAAANA